MSDNDIGIKKYYMKNYYCKRKNLLNHLINQVEELEMFALINFQIL